MTERDQELDDIEKMLHGGDPFIEKPDNLSISDGSACWLNIDRACGSDCRAYDVSVRPADNPAVCTVLGGVMDIADGLQGFIKYAAGNLRKANEDHVRAQAAAAAVPNPMPGRKP